MLPIFNSPLFDKAIFLPKAVIDQNKNKIVNELHNADCTLTIMAALSAGTNAENNRATNMKNGAPGG